MINSDVIIIGAGAAGLLAAISAGESGKSVLVTEKMNQPGRKLLITGKGRCNITNSAEIQDFITQIYPDGRFLYPAFKAFFNDDIIFLLDECGLETVLERGGRYFPKSEKAADVVEALMKKARDVGVKFKFDTKVNEIFLDGEKISGVECVTNGKIEVISVEKIIVCTGGKSYPGTGSTGDGYRWAIRAGHTIENLFPVLVPLVTKEDYCSSMQGLTLKNINAALYINDKLVNEEFGDLMFAHYGLSGPVILTLSRDVVFALESKSKIKILIDFKPALDNEKLDNRILRDINEHGKMKVGNMLKMWLPQKAIPVFLDILEIDAEKPAHQISANERRQIIKCLKSFELNIIGHRGYKEAVVTSGGVSLDEVNPKTMESKIINGLFFAGEVLNLDANTGGYNLQIAFSTGWLAGNSV
ncbi:MAG: NAD(P)/FAD-dependent oxidoreductase [Clostridia bacterium]|nr:NAD(P)/FAD-dependent oxidoreductase [Clostridia bacterium]